MSDIQATLAAYRVALDEGDGDAAYTLLAAVETVLNHPRRPGRGRDRRRVRPLRRPGVDDISKHLDWLGIGDCRCRHEWKGLGVLYGVSMGKGWVRMDTSPDCPHHGDRADRLEATDG